MSRGAVVLALDFGASSGRAIRAVYSRGKLEYGEIHRFDNNPVNADSHLRWDFPSLLEQTKQAIGKAGDIDSLAFDTWGVDFGLLDSSGQLLELPVHYRDSRTEGIIEPALTKAKLTPQDLYRATGTQIMEINTLFQLTALKSQNPETLDRAGALLFMPDLFSHGLCGAKVSERTIASTSQLLDLETLRWNGLVLERFGLPDRLLSDPIPTGTVIGKLEGGAKVVAAAGHDTQCAVAAMPAQPGKGEPAFLSCGTWSLLGCELEKPILTPSSQALGLSNELGADGKINYLKNIIGLWLIQESRREWRRQGSQYSYGDLEKLALLEKPLRSFIDPDNPVLTPPGDLPGRIQNLCSQSGQPVPQKVGSIVRCIYESLALKYRLALDQLSETTGKKFTVLHIMGGGAKDGLLCQLTADCTGLPVAAGPVEATALGNIIIQLTALGAIPDLKAGRELLISTEKQPVYRPSADCGWDEAYGRFRKLIKG